MNCAKRRVSLRRIFRISLISFLALSATKRAVGSGATAQLKKVKISELGPSKIPDALKHISPSYLNTLKSRPVAFIENKGQFDPRVKFQVRVGGKTLWLTNTGIIFDALRAEPGTRDMSKASGPSSSSAFGMLIPSVTGPPLPGRTAPDPGSVKFQRLVFSEEFAGGTRSSPVFTNCPQPGIYNYFIGNDPAKWVKGVHAFSQVIYRNVWKGIDVKLYGNGLNIEQEFVVHPGADPSRIQVAYKGIEGLEVGNEGSLVVHTAFGDLRESKPRVYRRVADTQIPVDASFKLIGQTAYTFESKPNEHQYALVIDPTLLYSTFLGGSGSDGATGIAVDAAGDAYVTGSTASMDFPITSGGFESSNPSPGNLDGVGFVTKLNPLGNQVIYSTYIGGPSGNDTPRGIALDSSGDAYITGGTQYSGFPTTTNAFQTGCGPSTFFTKLNATGDALLYSTCLGYAFNGYSPYGGVAVDSAGNAYLTGTASAGFPTTPNAFQQVSPGSSGKVHAFVSVVNPSASGASSLVYSTYLGGSELYGNSGTTSNGLNAGNDEGRAIAVDSYGDVYVTGDTASSDFPVTPGAFQTVFPPGTNVCLIATVGFSYCTAGFVAKLNPRASGPGSLIYATYLSGAQGAAGSGITVDSSGNAYVAGNTCSLSNQCSEFPMNFPTTSGAFQTAGSGFQDAFVAKLNPAGNSLIYSTYVTCATDGQSSVGGISLDSAGDAYIAGSTHSRCFPVTADGFQGFPGNGGAYGSNAYVTELNATGSSLVYSSYLGGTLDDSASAIAVDGVGDAYVAGSTNSTDFPVTGGAFQIVHGIGNCSYESENPCPDAFVTKFPLGAPQSLSILGMTPNSGGNAGSITPLITGAGFHAGATATLGGGGSDIVGTAVSVGVEGRTMNATFDLTNAAPGPVDLKVTNPDATSATLPNALTVQQGGEPALRVRKIGLKAVAGSPVQYFITISNIGNVDATDLTTAEFVQPWFTSLVAASPAPSSIVQAPALWPASVVGTGATYDQWLEWNTPRLSPGSSQNFNYTVMLDATYPLGSPVSGNVCTSGRTRAAVCIAATAACILGGAAGCLPIEGVPAAYPICVGTAFGFCFASEEDCFGVIDHWCAILTQDTTSNNFDPNYLVGPSGSGGQHWITGLEPLAYAVHFENEPTAGLPAQQVTVTNPLNSNLDLSTLTLATIALAGNSVPIPATFAPSAGLNEFTANLDLRPAQDLFVNVKAKLDPSAHTLTWTFTSIDPVTGQIPTDPSVGFLSPGADGAVFFTAKSKQPPVTGTIISDQGSVVFSGNGVTNPPVSTNAWTNTVDNTPPTSQIGALPADETSSCFKVQWSGSDVGSGIQGFTIFVSDDGSPYSAWQSNTSATSAVYSGKPGHEYAFYSEAADVAGNVEAAKTSPEATTAVAATATCGAAAPTLSGRILSRSLTGTTLTVVLQLTNTGSGPIQNIQINKFGLRTLSGTGTLTYPGLLPLFAGSLAAGANETLTLSINVPSTVTKFSLIENGTVQDASGNSYNFSIGQVVYP